MNTATLKSYAPKARKDFLNSVTDKAALLGISAKEQTPANITADTAVINGRPYSTQIGKQQIELVERVKKEGFQQVMEAIAYSWFNRFMAIRFMEIHDYLEHGYRVLSHPDGHDEPEILEKATSVELSGLNKQKVAELKLDGGKDEELYMLLLKAQCNELNKSMPFLFEHVADCTELLMPENLLHSDSVIREMVNTIDEEDWQEIEIIGWLYQFYISEKKDQVIGRVVKSEDIPAATQLFTPRWIVEYMVQNSLGRTWLNYKSDSPLKEKMDYYIEPAEQSDEVNKQLAELIPEELNPENLTLIDPACGSGHILVVAYDILFQIYKETGRKSRNIPRLILEKNLFGLDIDQRAVQLSTFALLMKARKDDSRILNREGLKLNIHEIPESSDLNANQIHNYLFHSDDSDYRTTIQELVDTFQYGKTYGSLITIDQVLYSRLAELQIEIRDKGASGDGLEIMAKREIRPLLEVALAMGCQYDVVVANPPYIGKRQQNAQTKLFLIEKFKGFDRDLFSAFFERNIQYAKPNGHLGFMSPFVWMFISSYKKVRSRFIEDKTISSLIQLEYSGFEGATVPICTFTIMNKHTKNFTGAYIRLTEFKGHRNQGPKALEAIQNQSSNWFYNSNADNFKKIPGFPIAYWAKDSIFNIFDTSKPLEEYANPVQGATTSDNERFLRYWHEVSFDEIGLNYSNCEEAKHSNKKWFPFNKGGGFRKWYGNHQYVINYKNDGEEIKAFHKELNKTSPGGRLKNQQYYFSPTISWSKISSASFCVRWFPKGFIFSDAGSCIFTQNQDHIKKLMGLLNSNIVANLLSFFSPTLNFEAEQLKKLPIANELFDSNKNFMEMVGRLLEIGKVDWDSFEYSWEFEAINWTKKPFVGDSIQNAIVNLILNNKEIITEMATLETDLNKLLLSKYDINGVISPIIPEDKISLSINPKYRYSGSNIGESELWNRYKLDSISELISYSIGCMMGRYSLDQQGLVYAKSGNIDFDMALYSIFQSDEDGILPLLDMDWEFKDDITLRFEEFLKTVWDEKTLFENLEFVAGAFSPKQNETPKNTIRRYLCSKFFDDHLKTYKKRPIYWLVSSGKEKAFEALIYLHRYNEATLARMRNDYVIPLQGKMNKRSAYLEDQVKQGGSASLVSQYQKEVDRLKKKQLELAKFDDLLKHYADRKISLDLDDGVKVNYGKFGTLLAKVKEITGIKPEELN